MRNPQERRRMLGQFQGTQNEMTPARSGAYRQRGIRNFGEVVSASSIPSDAKSGSYFDDETT